MRCPSCVRRVSPGAACPGCGGTIALESAGEAPRAFALETDLALESAGEAPRGFALEGYRIEGVLGRGGFAEVYGATRSDGLAVAIKVAHDARDERFEREAEALARLAPPAAPALFQSGRAGDGRPFLVLERVRGIALADWLAALPGSGAAPCERVDEILSGLASALDAVHAAGLVHRDLKPENVILRAGGGVTLLDFGLSAPRVREASGGGLADVLTRTGSFLGTPVYAAPEQIADPRAAGAAADVYALGVMLFEMLTGRPPFDGDAASLRRAHVAQRPPSPSALVSVKVGTDEVVARCLAKDPRRRFASAGEVARAFRAVTSSSAGASAAPVQAAAPAGETARRSARRVVALLAVRGRPEASTVSAAAAAEGGVVARRFEGVEVLAFAAASSPSRGVRAALSCARRLSGAGGVELPLVVHVAEVRVREGARGASVTGPAIEQPGTWPPGAGGGAVVCTEAAAAAQGADSGTSSAEQLLAQSERGAPLRGREVIVEEVVAVVARAFAERRPALINLTGDRGAGKTAVCEAIERALQGRGISVVRGAKTTPDTPGELRHNVARAAANALQSRAPVVVLLDDAHAADPAALDVLELATLEGSSAAVVVIAAARPELHSLRPGFGRRAASTTAVALGALDAAAAELLLLDRLRPVELVPRPVLAHLLELAGGVPLYLVEVARALREDGAVRRDPHGNGFFLAADEVFRLPAARLAEELAVRSLGRLSPPLLALARLCAALGGELVAAEVDAVAGTTTLPDELRSLDVGVGLSRLASAGILVARGERHAFRQPLLCEAIEAGTPPALRRNLHRAALDGLAGADPSRIARHAEAADDAPRAAAAHLGLAERARERHDFVTAEQRYSAALVQLAADDAAGRARCLTGRGKVRYRLQRFAGALADLRAARAFAEARGDGAAVTDLLLEESTVLDWLEDFPASKLAAELAAARCDGATGEPLRLRAALAEARSICRAQRMAESIPLLLAAAARARALGDHETRVIALLLVVGALSAEGRLDEAEERSEEVVAACSAAGDAFHLASAYIGRLFMWVKRRAADRAVLDQRLAMALARELGHAQLERMATLNLAELLYWMGSLDEALVLAERCRELQRRFFDERPSPDDTLLLARISVARGDNETAARHLDEVRARCPETTLTPVAATLARLVQLTLDDRVARRFSPEAWLPLLDQAHETAILHEQHEALYLAAETALGYGGLNAAKGLVSRASENADGFWRARFEALLDARQ